ncbi:hypothetical protein [Denitrificimonas caeni]|uniref:hypothetical protein n=1 Tax=Denitrificimonas caeni TaxID=521720 RepID=UPI00196295AF|nr:hypothetical protein [Denitrificimonas caeni]
MIRPHVTLGGLPIILHAGAVGQSYSQEPGWTDVRLSKGSLVRMAHWSKEAITMSGVGWMGLGFDALDYTQPLELRCTQPKTITGSGLTYTLNSLPRPDVAPWAHALVGLHWIKAQVSMSDNTATVAAVSSASAYRVSWMPVFNVLTTPPEEALDSSSASFTWQLTAREI